MTTRTADARRTGSPTPRYRLRIGQHLALLMLGEVTAFALGALAVFALLPAEVRTAAAPFDFVLTCVGAVAGVLGVRGLFGRVGARCPACGGRATPRGIRPITYHCSRCGHTHETRWRSNW